MQTRPRCLPRRVWSRGTGLARGTSAETGCAVRVTGVSRGWVAVWLGGPDEKLTPDYMMAVLGQHRSPRVFGANISLFVEFNGSINRTEQDEWDTPHNNN